MSYAAPNATPNYVPGLAGGPGRLKRAIPTRISPADVGTEKREFGCASAFAATAHDNVEAIPEAAFMLSRLDAELAEPSEQLGSARVEKISAP